jgi:polygalacturonase
VYHVTDYGADPTGAADATDAINKAIADAFRPPSNATMTGGIPDLGGAEVHLDGGTYLIKGPLTLPASGGGNFKVAIHHPWSYIQLPSHTRLGA